MRAKGAAKPPTVPQRRAAFDRFVGTVPCERARPLFVTGRSGPQHLVSFERLFGATSFMGDAPLAKKPLLSSQRACRSLY